MAGQLEFFRQESWNFFQRNFAGKNLREIPLSVHLERLLQSCPIGVTGGSILEVGCGAANNLSHLQQRLGARRGVGVEPSGRVVAVLSQAYPELEFCESDASALPYGTGEFDLVVLRSVLHWVDRDYLLQAIGEAIRVTRRYLLISDFAPHLSYSVVYHHQAEYRTFKIDYRPIVEATGFMRCLASVCSNDGDEWKGIRTSLFRKMALAEAFPLRSKEELEAR